MKQKDSPYNPGHKYTEGDGLILDKSHEFHRLQDKDSCTYYWHKPCHLDSQHWWHTLACTQRMDFQYSRGCTYRRLPLSVQNIQHWYHKVKDCRAEWFLLVWPLFFCYIEQKDLQWSPCCRYILVHDFWRCIGHWCHRDQGKDLDTFCWCKLCQLGSLGLWHIQGDSWVVNQSFQVSKNIDICLQ